MYAGEGYPGTPTYRTIGSAPGDSGTFSFGAGSGGYGNSITAVTKVWKPGNPGIISTFNYQTTIDVVNSFAPAFIIWKLTYNGTEYFVDSGFPKFTQALSRDGGNWNNPVDWGTYTPPRN